MVTTPSQKLNEGAQMLVRMALLKQSASQHAYLGIHHWLFALIERHTALVEALEAEDPGRWVYGVQWHPENLVGLDQPAGEAARALFRAFAMAVSRGGTRP